ncbi:signal peptidase II [Desulfurispira natronophila]|uniref:signal peptidase II n=1 Tax=Desulfurispira natronophila TaxID=682562 RepID=UPI001C8551BF
MVLDQLSKAAAQSLLTFGYSVSIIEGLFQLTLVYNPGAAFGLLGDLGDGIRIPFFFVVGVVAVVICFFLYRGGQTFFHRFGAVLIAGGAIGNLIDRVQLGKVVDFLDVYWKSWHWPAFNFADIYITVGAFAYIIALTYEYRMARRNK